MSPARSIRTIRYVSPASSRRTIRYVSPARSRRIIRYADLFWMLSFCFSDFRKLLHSALKALRVLEGVLIGLMLIT